MKAGPDKTLSEEPLLERRPVGETLGFLLGLLAAFVLVAVINRSSFVFTGDHIWVTLFLVGALIVLSAIDIDRYILPDWLTLPLIVIGIGYSALMGTGILLSGLGAVFGYGLVAALAWFWRKRFGKEGIGLGDAKLLAAGGAWVGVAAIPIILLVSSGVALALIGVLSLISKTSGNGTYIPFGPLLSLGIWFAWCAPIISA
ncbi:MAG: A24 family peptidase [Henriciella sp.]